MKILNDLNPFDESRITEGRDESKISGIKEDSRLEPTTPVKVHSASKFQLQTLKNESICSKVLFFKNFYLNPVLVDLIELAPYTFIVRISKYSVERIESLSKFFFVHSLMGIVNKHSKTPYSQLQNEAIQVFREIDWDELLISILFIKDEDICFTSEIKQFNYIRL